MKGPLMRLLYTVKMIYNISAFYNNSVRVASLLVKITYQAIISCKSYITDNGKVREDFVNFLKLSPDQHSIWNQDLERVQEKLRQCITLKDNYRCDDRKCPYSFKFQ